MSPSMISTSRIIQAYRAASDRNKPLRNIDQAKVFIPVPTIRQYSSYSCGSASFLSLLGYYGLDPNEKEVIKILGTTAQKGTSPDDFLKAGKKFGLKVKLQEDLTIEDIQNYLKKKLPVILDIQAWTEHKGVDYSKDWEDGHYVVAVGYGDKDIYLMDPSEMGYSYISFDDLEKRWHDVEEDGAKYTHLGIIVSGKEPKFDSEKAKPIE